MISTRKIVFIVVLVVGFLFIRRRKRKRGIKRRGIRSRLSMRGLRFDNRGRIRIIGGIMIIMGG